jgi:hypothetical protein
MMLNITDANTSVSLDAFRRCQSPRRRQSPRRTPMAVLPNVGGNCPFSALSDELKKHPSGSLSPESLRELAADGVENSPPWVRELFKVFMIEDPDNKLDAQANLQECQAKLREDGTRANYFALVGLARQLKGHVSGNDVKIVLPIANGRTIQVTSWDECLPNPPETAVTFNLTFEGDVEYFFSTQPAGRGPTASQAAGHLLALIVDTGATTWNGDLSARLTDDSSKEIVGELVSLAAVSFFENASEWGTYQSALLDPNKPPSLPGEDWETLSKSRPWLAACRESPNKPF